MTKKDYELIAKSLYSEFLDLGGKPMPYNYGRADGWRNVVYKLTVAFEKQSPKFNRDKFLKACGLEV